MDKDSTKSLTRGLKSKPQTEPSAEAIIFQARLLDTLAQAVIATDLEGRITYWNRFAEELFGRSSAEVLGCNVVEVTRATASQDPSEIMAYFRRKESSSREFQLKRHDGTVFPALVTASPVIDEQGQLIGILGIS